MRCRLLTAFVNVLPREAVLRVWDIMLFMRSPCVLFRVLLMVFESVSYTHLTLPTKA